MIQAKKTVSVEFRLQLLADTYMKPMITPKPHADLIYLIKLWSMNLLCKKQLYAVTNKHFSIPRW